MIRYLLQADVCEQNNCYEGICMDFFLGNVDNGPTKRWLHVSDLPKITAKGLWSYCYVTLYHDCPYMTGELFIILIIAVVSRDIGLVPSSQFIVISSLQSRHECHVTPVCGPEASNHKNLPHSLTVYGWSGYRSLRSFSSGITVIPASSSRSDHIRSDTTGFFFFLTNCCT